ncbi:extracellular solute-binding protein [Microbacterium sp. 179-I 3D3 NHS]|uniref:extracellular solute-binding protein n=1 Tax=Microbacterium sp. 179-I 3D3 NHS TaxID=3142382 RepID=UPI0039A27FB6
MRSRMNKALAATALTLVTAVAVAGCSAGGDAAGDQELDLAPAVAGEIEAGALDGITLVYAGNGGITQEGQDEAIWQPFSEESGAIVEQDAFELTKLRAMVDSGNVDWNMVVSSSIEVERYCGELYEEIDTEKVDLSKVPDGTLAGDCMVPNIFYGYVVAYNADVYGDNAPQTAADFFDTEKFPGKRGVPVTPWMESPAVEFAMVANGADFDALTPEDFTAGLEAYSSLGSDLVPWTTGAQSQQQLESGEVDMALVWSGRGYGAANAGAPIVPMWGDWVVAVDGIAIPKGSANLDASFAAINYMLGADQQAASSELTSYAPVNVDAKPAVSEPLTDWLVSDHLDTGHTVSIDYWVENWDEFSAEWTDWVAGS